MENLLLPFKIEIDDTQAPNTATVTITPCFHGYGTTLGNAYRRVLLSSLPGSAVEAFKVKGIQHEFSTVEGVKEDGVEVILNLKQLAVQVFTDDAVTLHLSKKGPGLVTAADFDKNSNAIIVNKDMVICTLTENKTFEMDVVVGRGRGYKPAEEKDRKNYDLGVVVIDSIYTPIKDVGYRVEYTRVGDITNYEKLMITIETNGTMSPKDALQQATQILMDHFNIIMNAIREEGVKEPAVEAAPESAPEAEAVSEGGETVEAENVEVKKEKRLKRRKANSE